MAEIIVDLAGIAEAGYSPDGDFVTLVFEGKDGNHYRFSLPHEGLGQIIFQLSSLEHKAAEQRQKAGTGSKASTPKRAFPLTGFEVGFDEQSSQVMLSLKASKDMHLSFLMLEKDAEAMKKGISKVLKLKSRRIH